MRRGIFVVVTTCLLLADAKLFAITLVENGQPKAVLVVDGKAPAATFFAAQELVQYVRKISGADLPIVKIDTANANLRALTAKQNVILVGDPGIARKFGVPSEKMASDAFRIVCHGKTLAVLGKDDPDASPADNNFIGNCGTTYGVYRLLDSWGVRWYFPGELGEVVPKRTTLEVPDSINLIDAPFFPYRKMGVPAESVEASIWMRRVGFGTTVDPTDWNIHPFVDWGAKYFASHPEYFALQGNNRLSSYICFYGKGVRQLMIDQAKKWLQATNPKRYPYFTMTENDGVPGPCNCPECQKRITRQRGWYGSMSDYVTEAAIQVAKGIQTAFPDRGVVIGAYNEYTMPPLHVKQLPPNVAVQIFRHRLFLYSPEARKNVYATIDGWLALKPKAVAFWDYYNIDNWGKYLGVPVVATQFIAEDIHRLKQLSEQSKIPFLGEHTFCNKREDHVWWLGLDIYVTGKCLWNPDLDRQKLLDNFYTEYFGPAAPAMKQFYGRIEDVWVHGDHGGRNYYCSKDASSFDKIIKTGFVSANPWKCLFTPPILKELAGYLEKAKKQAKDAPYRDRVEWVGKGFAFTLKCAAPLQ